MAKTAGRDATIDVFCGGRCLDGSAPGLYFVPSRSGSTEWTRAAGAPSIAILFFLSGPREVVWWRRISLERKVVSLS